MTSPLLKARRCDVAIVGAGPGGATLAALLAMEGVDVALFERDAFPRDKLCGEFLSFEAHPVLDRIGVLEQLSARAAVISTSRIFAQSGQHVSTALPAPALGISRLWLDEALFEAAGALGARTFERAEVKRIEREGDVTTLEVDGQGLWRPRLTIGAWGRRTKLDRQLKREFIQERHPWVGLKQHHGPRGAAENETLRAILCDTVELHAFEGGYCGINYVDEEVLNVCALMTLSAFAKLERDGSSAWEALNEMMSASSASLRARLELMTPLADRATQAVAQVPFERKDLCDGSLFWLGDAAGMITPMTGDGQAMAIQSADLFAPIAVELISALRSDEASALKHYGEARERWQRSWEGSFKARHRLGRVLQSMLVQPRAAELAIRLGARFPALPDWLTRATRGEAPTA